jgi:hypothetical protein
MCDDTLLITQSNLYFRFFAAASARQFLTAKRRQLARNFTIFHGAANTVSSQTGAPASWITAFVGSERPKS